MKIINKLKTFFKNLKEEDVIDIVFETISVILLVAIFVVFFYVHKTVKEIDNESSSVIMNIETTTTVVSSTTVKSTTISSTTTSMTTTKMSSTTTETEAITTSSELIVETNPVYEEETYTEEITEETTDGVSNSGSYFYKSMEGTYYCGGSGTYGRWGRDLISGYSVAINGLADGTIVYIESDCPGVTGTYRVDDTGGMGYNVVDFYYSYNNVPSEFSWRGRINVDVYIVE